MGTTKQADTLNKVRIPDELYAKLQIEARGAHRSASSQIASILADHYSPRVRAEAPAVENMTPVVPPEPVVAPPAPPPVASPWTPLRHLRVAARDMTVEEVMKLNTDELRLMSRALTRLASAEATAAARRIKASEGE
jgi:hypothetical protein